MHRDQTKIQPPYTYSVLRPAFNHVALFPASETSRLRSFALPQSPAHPSGCLG